MNHESTLEFDTMEFGLIYHWEVEFLELETGFSFSG